MSAKVTVSISLQWSETGGYSIKGTIATPATQAGGIAIGNVQVIGATTEAIDLGDCTGAKTLMLENRDTTKTIYVEATSSATTSSAIKLAPGQGFITHT